MLCVNKVRRENSRRKSLIRNHFSEIRDSTESASPFLATNRPTRFPKWQYWVTAAALASAVAVGWKLHALLSR